MVFNFSSPHLIKIYTKLLLSNLHFTTSSIYINSNVAISGMKGIYNFYGRGCFITDFKFTDGRLPQEVHCLLLLSKVKLVATWFDWIAYFPFSHALTITNLISFPPYSFTYFAYSTTFFFGYIHFPAAPSYPAEPVWKLSIQQSKKAQYKLDPVVNYKMSCQDFWNPADNERENYT